MLKDLLAALQPIIRDRKTGRRRISKEASLSLLKMLFGALVALGILGPETAGHADQLNVGIWNFIETFGGLYVMVQSLLESVRRHREAKEAQP